MTRTVGARELKTRLGSYLQEVEAGATLVVTERGRPVAELRPIASRAGDPGADLQALVAAGVLTGGRAPLAAFVPLASGTGGLADEVVRGREDRV
jgi:prevent-host-death family protein